MAKLFYLCIMLALSWGVSLAYIHKQSMKLKSVERERNAAIHEAIHYAMKWSIKNSTYSPLLIGWNGKEIEFNPPQKEAK